MDYYSFSKYVAKICCCCFFISVVYFQYIVEQRKLKVQLNEKKVAKNSLKVKYTA